MKEEKDYIRDLAEIRSMMERSSKFLSLSGWAGIMAGSFALAGAVIAWKVFDFHPDSFDYGSGEDGYKGFINVFILAMVVLVLALASAFVDSYRKASKKGERAWNSTSRRLLINMAVPLLSGGILLVPLVAEGLIGLLAPLTLLFYGLALFNAGNFTFKVVRVLGLVQIGLALINCFFIEHGLLFWALGFGLGHIVYGIYMFRFER